MSIFSLDWFKSEKQKQREALEQEERRLLIKVLKKEAGEEAPVKNAKPYLNVKLVGDVLTIVLLDGNILTKPNATQEHFKQAREAIYEGELFKIASSSEGIEEKRRIEQEVEKQIKTIEGFDVLKGLPDFTVDGRSVYLTGTNRTLPALLVEKFAEVVGKAKEEDIRPEELTEYVALKRFFLWCCLNPRAEVADQLYEFLVNNSFRITKQGFFTALRNVVTVEGDNELVKFVSNSYNKVKAVWKKKPADYYVHRKESGEYYFDKQQAHNGVGNLQDLYLDLPNMAQNRFTDAYTQKFDIRIGQVVNMPPDQCSWSTADCAHAGLHFTADQIHYVGCGDTSVLVLINPMKVVGIGQQKGRCYEYLPIMTVPREEATKLLHDLDFDTLELDEDFAIRELEGLADRVKEGFAVEAKKYEFNIPQISSKEVNNIISSLEEMKNTLSKRVVDLDD